MEVNNRNTPERPTPKLNSVQNMEFKEQTKPLLRSFEPKDLEDIVELDIKSFKDVYDGYGKSEEELKEELTETFKKRIELIGQEWTQVLEDRNTGKILGFLMSCPTSKKPEDFTSWEDTTDDGSLASTYDENGKDLYVISLTTTQNSLGRYDDMLYAGLMKKGVEEGYRRAFFETRLPGLRNWLQRECEKQGKSLEDLTDEEKYMFAEKYMHLKKQRDGKEVPYDPLLRSFSKMGCDFVKLVPNAYQDEPSLNFGVLTVVENPLPEKIQNIKPIKKMIGKAASYALRSEKLSKVLFRETMPSSEEKPEKTKTKKTKEFLNKHSTKLLLGAAAVSFALTVVANPFEQTKDEVIDAAPWVGGGLFLSEAMWIGGAAMMLTSVGDKVKNPLKIRKKLPELAKKANSSKLFKSGFYINTAGAVGSATVISAGVVDKLPFHSWGLLGLAVADLGVTIAVRKAILRGIKKVA